MTGDRMISPWQIEAMEKYNGIRPEDSSKLTMDEAKALMPKLIATENNPFDEARAANTAIKRAIVAGDVSGVVNMPVDVMNGHIRGHNVRIRHKTKLTGSPYIEAEITQPNGSPLGAVKGTTTPHRAANKRY